MFQINSGKTRAYCDGLSRRSFVRLGIAGMASAGLADVLRAKVSAAQSGVGNDKAAILLWLDGGPGHMDLYDLKPNAPSEYRGIWRPIRTNVPGIEISELFPKQAQVADKFAIVRSLHHDTGGHFNGAHRMLTAHRLGGNGSREGRFPSIGSVVTRTMGSNQSGMPPYISVPYASSVGLNPGYFAGNWLGAQYDPFKTGGNPNKKNFKVQNLDPVDGLSIERLADRKALHSKLDQLSRAIDASGTFDALDSFDQDAYEFVAGRRVREAFDINREDTKTRDLYGRHQFGQSTLLARRLVEAGARFVTVHNGGWDHHWNLQRGMESKLPHVDDAVSALLSDLSERGLLESTMVILCGEFSRTPRMNTGHNGKGTPGRDHWGNSMFCLLAGGGIRGGQIIGATDAKGERPAARAVRPHHIHATVYRALGLDPALHLLDHKGRPTPVLEDPTPIEELF